MLSPHPHAPTGPEGRPAGAAPLDVAHAAESMIDARTGHRVALDRPVRLELDGPSGSLPARLRDLSLGGACVSTRSPIALQSVRRISLDLCGERALLRAEGRWQGAASDLQVSIGLSFREASHHERDLLEHTIDHAARLLAKFVESSPELPKLSHEDAMALALCSRYRTVPQGGVVYRQGASEPAGDSFLIVAEGEIVLHRRVRDARNVTLSRLGARTLFGGLPLLADVPNLEYAVASVPSRLLEITRPSFALMRIVNPLLAQRVTRYATAAHLNRLSALLERAEGVL